MSAPVPLRFLRSARTVGELPAAELEIALVGRSNVGKSSLLNALARRRDLARTSKTPGATRLLNVFEAGPVGSGRWLVDLPGYGYAKVPGSERQRWKGMVEGYLLERATLDRVLVLVDGEVGPTPLDLQTLDWLDEIGLPVRLIATKSDKVRSSRRAARRAELAERLGVARAEVAWVSAERGTGIDELRAEVLALLGLA